MYNGEAEKVLRSLIKLSWSPINNIAGLPPYEVVADARYHLPVQHFEKN